MILFLNEASEVFSDMMSDKPHNIRQRLMNKAKILLVCLQIVFQCIVSLDVEYPKEVVETAKAFWNVFGLNPAEVFPVDCLNDPTQNAYWRQLQMVTIVPIMLLLIIALYYSILRARSRDTYDKENCQRSMLAIIVGISFIILPSTSSAVLNTLNVEYTRGDDIDYAYLAVDYSTKINSRVYQNMMRPYALICVLIYPIGIPVFFLTLLRANLAKVDPNVMRPRKLDDDDGSPPVPRPGRQYVDSSHMLEVNELAWRL